MTGASRRKVLFFVCMLLAVSAFAVHSQTGGENAGVTTVPVMPTRKQKPKSEFPQWALDLRRFDIILFGSFPFAYWFASTGVDLYRSSQHNWDARYAPWPVKSAGAVNMTNDEYMVTLSFAFGGSVIAALVDHIIVRAKRNKAARELPAVVPGEVIITRTPKPGGGGEDSGGADPGGSSGGGGDASGDAGPETAPAEAP